MHNTCIVSNSNSELLFCGLMMAVCMIWSMNVCNFSLTGSSYSKNDYSSIIALSDCVLTLLIICDPFSIETKDFVKHDELIEL